jgi:phosphate ABC transporter substrate-binding protein
MVTALIVVFGILIAIWIWTFSSVGQTPIIIGGSTSANAFMQKVTTKISTVDYTYNSTGSQNGVNGVFNKVYTGGMISKDPTNFGKPVEEWSYYDSASKNETINAANLDDYLAAKQNDKKRYTATQLGIDAIAVIYNLPGQLDQPEINFYLDEDVLKNIYEGKINNWSDVPGLQKKVNVEIKPFTREVGSGTRTAFEEKTRITNAGQADVANSNGMMFNSIGGTEGSIGFVSLPFIGQIEKNSNIHVAGIDGKRFSYPDDDDEQSFKEIKKVDEEAFKWVSNINKETNDVAVGRGHYHLSRPFVLIYKNSSIKKLKALFEFLVCDAYDIYREEGLSQQIHDIKITNGNKPMTMTRGVNHD